MKRKYILFFIFFSQVVFGQTSLEIEGRIMDKETRVSIPYVNVFNTTFKHGTISNNEGYFRISVKDLNDSISISFIGYKKQILRLEKDKFSYMIYLEENIQILDDVIIYPNDNSYLYDLLYDCRKKLSNYKVGAKAYYELKSFKDDTQVELVEGFYNVGITGYELTSLDLKAGRLALRPYQNRLFASLESTRAIVLLKLRSKNYYFPANPLELSKQQLKTAYYLTLDKKYYNETDSIYIINYIPRDTSGLFFEGKLWINKAKTDAIKITLNCKACRRHPFLPMFRSDSILNVSFNITKSFTSVNDKVVFNHIDFVYTVDYKSRIRKENALHYSIKTNAILYAYDFHSTFFIPRFNFKDVSAGDYRKINAMPYNTFFWECNDEYKLNDSKNKNELFFADSGSITNKVLFEKNIHTKKGLFEHPYVSWSQYRIIFHEISTDTALARGPSSGFKVDQYNLAVKIFVDVNSYKDSTHILTAAIFDPYESFYHLPLDNKAHCFINMYFDLCEIERRKLEGKLRNAGNDRQRMEELYNEFMKKMDEQKYQYMKSVERGTNENEMKKWNVLIYKELGIDNIAQFNPYTDK